MAEPEPANIKYGEPTLTQVERCRLAAAEGGPDLSGSHLGSREQLLAAAKEKEAKEKEARRARFHTKKEETAEVKEDQRGKLSQAVEHIEFIGGMMMGKQDEFKQASMADESHLELENQIKKAKRRSAEADSEVARFEAEQAALQEEAELRASSLMRINQKRKEAAAAELAKKKARPGVLLGGAKKADEAPAARPAAATAEAKAPAATTAPAGLGLLGGYGSDDSDSDEDDEED
eukprot:gnl/TRDRNA2_/TRDRNA2_197363_c0_seq1.p1 gnl/TRDRNA2_/TRDRNA2_197363_c0~~gnl/TRDRNA2_/TRDRNA2_197363_c0_seq1.p1  ORF type:complete len:263 (+),score=81.01 gnl/TRDRNA2_/TRDRNA2_197363_c0_seq1:88-789(+)